MISKDMPLHRIMIKGDMVAIEVAMILLRENGYKPLRGKPDPIYGTPLDFTAPADEQLLFLRPTFLPPLKDAV